MADNPLNIISTSDQRPWVNPKTNLRQESRAKFERLWHLYPKQFDSSRNCLEKERINRTLELIKRHIDLNGKKVLDLGCGRGTLSRALRDLGAHVDGVDVAENAFDKKDSENIEYFQDYVPRTKLADDAYDVVVAADLIAYLDLSEFRLFMAEVSRLVKPSGLVFISTPLDINSDDSLQRFHQLSETEFLITEWIVSHNRFWIRLHDFFAAPKRFVKAYKDSEYRKIKLSQRRGFSAFWFKINSVRPLVFISQILQYLFNPISRFIEGSQSLLLNLEKVCSTLCSIRGITHASWIGRRRPLVEHTPLKDQPQERPGKKQIWE